MKNLPKELWLTLTTIGVWIGAAVGFATVQTGAENIAGAAVVTTLGLWIIVLVADRAKYL